MADVITRFKLETTQYDSKLREAAQKLKEFGREADKAGADFQKLSQSNIEAARAFGSIATSATSTKDKLKELVQAYNDVARAYNNLTQEQQQSDIGKAMTQSLEQLNGRIKETKQELQGMGGTMKDTSKAGDGLSGVLDKVAGKFGMNISQLSKFGVAMGALTAALKVAKDAFFASESQVDEWGRTMEAGRAVYDSFLQTLNGGNFGGFFSNLDNVIAKARAAYNAIDDLNTMMTIINPERAKLQARQTKLQATIRREGANSAAGRQAQEELKALEPKLQASYRTEAGMNWNAFGALVDEKLASAGINLDARSKRILMQSFHDTGVYNRLRAGARGSREYVGGTSTGTTSYGMVASNGRWVDTRNTNQKLLDLFTDEWRRKNSGYLTASFNALSQSYGVTKANARYVNAGGGGGGGGGSRGGGGGRGGGTTQYVPVEGSIDAQAAMVANLQKAWRAAADDDSRVKIKKQIEEAQAALDKMEGKTPQADAPVGSMKYYSNWLKELQEKQQEVTTTNDWEYYAGQIDFVTKKMKELRGEVEQMEMATAKGGATGNNISAWLSGQQKSLADTEIGSAESRSLWANIIDTTTLQNVLNSALETGIEIDPDVVENLWSQILGEDNIPDSVWQDLADSINSQLAALGLEPLQIDFSTGNVTKGVKEMKEGWQDAAKAVQAVGNAMQQIQDPTARVMGIIGEAIANIALGFAQATSKDSKGGVIAWIASIAAGIGTMVSTISAIHNATGYSEGGVIPGNRYSGDMQWARVNAGEVILNRAQASNIAGQLEGGVIGNLHLETYLAGEDLRIAVTNANKRRGRGEYAYSKK